MHADFGHFWVQPLHIHSKSPHKQLFTDCKEAEYFIPESRIQLRSGGSMSKQSRVNQISIEASWPDQLQLMALKYLAFYRNVSKPNNHD